MKKKEDEENKVRNIMVRTTEKMMEDVDRVRAARSRKRGELLRLYSEKCLRDDLARLDGGDPLDPLGGMELPSAKKTGRKRSA